MHLLTLNEIELVNGGCGCSGGEGASNSIVGTTLSGILAGATIGITAILFYPSTPMMILGGAVAPVLGGVGGYFLHKEMAPAE